ncbi:MAG: hypothetical protein FWG14_08895 [Peptococcaceae bacterium]|nr:hypothetical protein [Peptococcaceae bacterium]
MAIKGAVKKNIPHQDLEYPLSPFTLALSFAASITHLRIGPSTGIFIPLISNSWPFAYVAVILLDIFAALAVKRSLIIEGQIPAPFEFAWRNPDQEYILGAPRIAGQSASAPEATPSDNPGSDNPVSDNPPPDGPLFPPGISINLVLDTPLRTRRSDSSAVFIYQIIDFPKVPCWLLIVATFIIYSISHIYWHSTKDEEK